MRLQLLCFFAILCLVGCQPHQQQTLGQNVVKNLSLTTSDEKRIRMVVYEHLIRNELKPAPGDLLFVAAEPDDLEKLTEVFSDYRVENESDAKITLGGEVRDKKTKQVGVILEVKSITTSNGKTSVVAGYFDGAGVSYIFELEKDSDWRIKEVRGKVVSDH